MGAGICRRRPLVWIVWIIKPVRPSTLYHNASGTDSSFKKLFLFSALSNQTYIHAFVQHNLKPVDVYVYYSASFSEDC